MELAAASGPTVDVRIGSRAVTYHVYETTAPRAYDGFGTRALYGADGETGYVLIDDAHLTWQVTRYQSGMCSAVPSDAYTADDLAEQLWGAMVAPFA